MPVNTQLVGSLPVPIPAAIMWSAAAQKSGEPRVANPLGSSAKLYAPKQFVYEGLGNNLSHEHWVDNELADGSFAGGDGSAIA